MIDIFYLQILDFATREENNQFYFYDDVEDFADDPHVYHLKFEKELSEME